MAPPRRRPPVHPGEVLQIEFLDELGISAYRLAKGIGVPLNRITGILKGQRAITADTALRLERFFGVSAEHWINLQKSFELDLALRHSGRQLEKIRAWAP